MPRGACHSLLEFPISNQGPCELTITNIALTGADAGDYSFVGLPSFPIVLGPGEVVGDGDFRIQFAPTAVDRNRVANLAVTYVTDPLTSATATVTRHLCGEGTRTGVRIFVTVRGIPVPLVKSIKVRRLNANVENHELNSVCVAMNLTPQTVNPGSPCEGFTYHREFGTAATADRLLAGTNDVTATVRLGLTNFNKSIGFDVRTCDFHTLVIDFAEDPEFSAAYVLQGDDEAAIREVFDPQVRAWFAERAGRGFHFEAQGNTLVFHLS